MMMTTFGEDTACAAVVGAIRAATSPRGTAHLQHRRTIAMTDPSVITFRSILGYTSADLVNP
jgi:hypothetical protein